MRANVHCSSRLGLSFHWHLHCLHLNGKVTVQFVVDKSGKVKDIEVLRSAYPCLDDEAIRVIALSPLWTPGENNGKAVDVYFTIPVSFKLQQEKSGYPELQVLHQASVRLPA